MDTMEVWCNDEKVDTAVSDYAIPGFSGVIRP